MIIHDYANLPINFETTEVSKVPKDEKTIKVARAYFSDVPVAEITSNLLKTKALVVVSIKMAMVSLGKGFKHSGLLILGALLLPVNLIAGLANSILLGKDLLSKKYSHALSKLFALLGNIALSITGAAFIKAYLLPAMNAVASSALRLAKIAGPIGLFCLSAAHLVKVGNLLYALYHAKTSTEKKEILIDLFHNLAAVIGLFLLGLIMMGALGAQLATPAGWISAGLILIALTSEVIHSIYKKKNAPPPETGLRPHMAAGGLLLSIGDRV